MNIKATFEREKQSPLELDNYPELDEWELLEEKKATLYQYLIGLLQWAIRIGRLNILTSVNTIPSFCAAPRKGHLERLSRITSAAILVRVEAPNF